MIDKKLQAELRAKFNPDGSDLRKMQLRMLDMLKYIDKICRENNITYWLSSGTCLGAVRHGGFIPWDDDIDIEMLEKDYKKLRNIIKQQSKIPFIWQDRETDEDYKYPFAKLRDKYSIITERNGHDSHYKYKGIFIDIFILTPSNSLKIRKFTTFLYSWSIRKISKTKMLKRYSGIVYKVLSILERIQAIWAQDRLRHISGTYFYKERRYHDIGKVKYIKFEDTFLPIPKYYHNYLSLLYSNYSQLPSLSNLSLPHTIKVTFLD